MIDEFLAGDNTKLADILLDPVTSNDGTRFTNKSGAERQRNKKSFLFCSSMIPSSSVIFASS